MQQRIDTVADQIRGAAAGPEGTGFGSIVVEPERGRLRLYWKGAVPSPVRAVLAKDSGVTVLIEPAAYSEAELLSEIDRMVASQPAGRALPANQITGVGPRPDSSGLRVFVNGSASAGRELSAVAAATVPTTVEGGVLPRTVSRADDSSPYFGGARWSGSSLSCSTGFAVTQGTTTKVLSAAHCTADGSFAFDGGGDPMGTVTKPTVPARDSLLIDARAAGIIFNGFGATETINFVAGQLGNNFGDLVCTSGAFSGTRCNIRIVGPNVSQTFVQADGTTVFFNRLVMADQQSGLNAAGNGDSGGPVFSYGADPTTVFARGTVTGADTPTSPVTCTGVPASSTRSCSSRVWYTPIALSLDGFSTKLQLVTN
ncbi:MAG: hypothetical protein ACJ72N_06315 [Labedaea sp.]